jgi:4-hydroxy-2-oxoglutarate aldolase
MPALITPFDPDQRIEIGMHQHNVSTAISAGAGGILIAGSTGEGPYLETGERSILVSSAREAEPDITIVCGVAAESDRQTATQITEAAEGGADAVLVLTPGTLVRNRTAAITDFYERVATTSPLPVLLYTNPPVTGYELPVETVCRLAEHPNIVGMKDSGGDFSRLEQMDEPLAGGFVAYIGSSKALVESTSRGAFGAITASANYAFAFVDSSASGDRNAQAVLADVTSVVQQYGVAGTKYAATLAGMREGRSRLPLQPLDTQAKQSVVEAYETMLGYIVS